MWLVLDLEVIVPVIGMMAIVCARQMLVVTSVMFVRLNTTIWISVIQMAALHVHALFQQQCHLSVTSIQDSVVVVKVLLGELAMKLYLVNTFPTWKALCMKQKQQSLMDLPVLLKQLMLNQHLLELVLLISIMLVIKLCGG
jgi:hypothetical protein